MGDFEEKLKRKTDEIEGLIEVFLPPAESEARTVIEAANYSVRAGGKRLRPLLMSETYKLFEGRAGDGQSVSVESSTDGESGSALSLRLALQRFMAAIEFIHTYSLVHDDLPAMDNDMLRRGKPTTHAVYGEAMAILAGDALLNYAYETAIGALAEYGGDMAFDNDTTDSGLGKADTPREPRTLAAIEYISRVSRALMLLSEKAGIYGMVGGQCVDVESEKTGTALTREKLDYIYENKTGALLEAAMGIGAILGGANDDEYAAVLRIASHVGLAFQIRDDILDATGDEETLGKPIGSDERNEKATYVAFEGIERAEADVKRLTDEAIEELRGLHGDSGFLEELLRSLIDRDR